jgi:maleamate amidohydrolase
MSVLKEAEEALKKRGFGRLIGFGKAPALVVIDFQRGFTDPALPLGSNLDSQLAATVQLLDAARQARIPVYFTVVWYDEQGFADAGIWLIKSAGQSSLKAGSPAVELDPRLGRRPEEATILKKYASAFFGTDLVSRLTARRVDTVVLVGCTTSGCVRATAVDALQHGFRPMVVKEGVGDRLEPAHEQSLFDMQIKYADVISLDETIAYLRQLK